MRDWLAARHGLPTRHQSNPTQQAQSQRAVLQGNECLHTSGDVMPTLAHVLWPCETVSVPQVAQGRSRSAKTHYGAQSV